MQIATPSPVSRRASCHQTIFVCGGNINQDALRLGSVTTFRARSLSFAMPTPFTSANSSLAFHPVGIPTSGYLRLSDVLPSLSHRHTGRGDPSPPQQAKTVSSQARECNNSQISIRCNRNSVPDITQRASSELEAQRGGVVVLTKPPTTDTLSVYSIFVALSSDRFTP